MENRSKEHGKLNIGVDSPLERHVTNPGYESSSLSQSSDASFQLNRLLNFNVAKCPDVDPDDQRGDNKMLNFSIPPKADDMGMFLSNKKQRPLRDPTSHRIIEKRRRDRMNNCLADLSQLIPSPYLKQGQGRIEKTEIIEMAIKHIRQIQTRLTALGNETPKICCKEKFTQGYEECRENIMRYLMESLGFQPAETQNMYKYLENQLEKRKASLPEICTCSGPDPVTASTATAATVSGTISTKMLPPLEPIQMDSESSQLGQPSNLTPKSEPSVPKHHQQHHSLVAESPMVLPNPEQKIYDSQASYAKRQRSTSETHSNFSPQLERRASMPKTDKSRVQIVSVENRESAMVSPAVSDTSITPLVGEEMYLSSEGRLMSGSYNDEGVSGENSQYGDSGMHSNMSSYNTDQSSQGGPISARQDSVDAKNSGYKFKNDIKWRFTADADITGIKDDMSHDLSRDVGKEEFKDPPLPPHSQSVCSGDSISNSSNGNGSSGNNGDRSSISTGYSSNGNSSSSSMDTSLTNTVPAFALHPTGVYYVPLVLPVSQVMPFMKNHRSMGICHPISIPVSFTGPFHMGIPQVNYGLTLGSGYAGDKMRHRHRHGNTGRRSHGDSHNRSAHREAKSVNSSSTT